MLKHSGLIQSIRRGYFKITDRGIEALSQNVTIDNTFLKQFPEYHEFIRPKDEVGESTATSSLDISKGDKTPDEIFEDNYEAITDILISEVLEKVKACTPQFFENMVIDLLVKMGYGGSLRK